MDRHLKVIRLKLICHLTKLLQWELSLRLLESIHSFWLGTFLEIIQDKLSVLKVNITHYISVVGGKEIQHFNLDTGEPLWNIQINKLQLAWHKMTIDNSQYVDMFPTLATHLGHLQSPLGISISGGTRQYMWYASQHPSHTSICCSLLLFSHCTHNNSSNCW